MSSTPIIDEYSRYPICFPLQEYVKHVSDLMFIESVLSVRLSCLHAQRQRITFMSREMKEFLTKRGCSKSILQDLKVLFSKREQQ